MEDVRPCARCPDNGIIGLGADRHMGTEAVSHVFRSRSSAYAGSRNLDLVHARRRCRTYRGPLAISPRSRALALHRNDGVRTSRNRIGQLAYRVSYGEPSHPMSDLYLGVDGGQSSTVAVIGNARAESWDGPPPGPATTSAQLKAHAKFLRVMRECRPQAARPGLRGARARFRPACLGMSGGPADKDNRCCTNSSIATASSGDPTTPASHWRAPPRATPEPSSSLAPAPSRSAKTLRAKPRAPAAGDSFSAMKAADSISRVRPCVPFSGNMKDGAHADRSYARCFWTPPNHRTQTKPCMPSTLPPGRAHGWPALAGAGERSRREPGTRPRIEILTMRPPGISPLGGHA